MEITGVCSIARGYFTGQESSTIVDPEITRGSTKSLQGGQGFIAPRIPWVWAKTVSPKIGYPLVN